MILKNKSQSVEEIVDNIVWIVSQWGSKRDEFEGIFLEDITRSWAPVLYCRLSHKGGDQLSDVLFKLGIMNIHAPA